MPMKPLAACEGPGPHSNGGLAEKGYYCNNCRKQKQEGQPHYSKSKEMAAFYNSAAWKNLRQVKLHRNSLCELCEKENPVRYTPGFAVDHIRDHDLKMEIALSYENLMTLCEKHHNSKTASQHGFNSDNSDLAPETLPVSIAHSSLPDGYEGLKEKYNRWYRKNGVNWVLLPKDHKPLDKQI
jgi:5-methylcytosine-specific restriction protein A